MVLSRVWTTVWCVSPIPKVPRLSGRVRRSKVLVVVVNALVPGAPLTSEPLILALCYGPRVILLSVRCVRLTMLLPTLRVVVMEISVKVQEV